MTSIPITPPGADRWGTLTFSATVPASTGLTVDVLDGADTVVLANVSNGADLDAAGVKPDAQPTLKLRATLTAATVGLTPQLHEWGLAWVVEERRVYLPVVVK